MYLAGPIINEYGLLPPCVLADLLAGVDEDNDDHGGNGADQKSIYHTKSFLKWLNDNTDPLMDREKNISESIAEKGFG